MSFTGFTEGSLGFLAELSQHNDRAWFAENRERYERDLLGRQRDFVDAIGTAFAGKDQRVQAVPAVDRSIFRINRDTRFARDKSPYKTHADMIFWIGADRKAAPAYWLRLAPASISIGAGTFSLTDEQLARYREAVVDGLHGQWLGHIVEDLAAQRYQISEPDRKTVPRGFDAQHPRADLLKHTQIHAVRTYTPPPEQLYGPEFVEWTMEHFAQVKPLVDWLADNLGGIFAPDMRL
jgi:uncharacterized protein (TIGR02453 family)